MMTETERKIYNSKKFDEHMKAKESLTGLMREWHQWFAWRPVWDWKNGYIMWMENVMRRDQHYDASSWFHSWAYRPITLLPADVGADAE